MNEFGFKGVAFLEVQAKDWQGVNVWRTLLDRSWELGSHSWHHLHLGSLSMSSLVYEINESRNWIQQTFGVNPISFAYPFTEGSKNSTVLQVLYDSGYLYARAGGAENWKGERSLRINCYDFNHTDYVNICPELIRAASSYGYAVAAFHRVNSFLQGWNALLPEDFRYVLKSLKDSGLVAVTFEDLEKARPVPVRAETHFSPDPLNLERTDGWIETQIELPEGYNLSNIDVHAILLNGTIRLDLSVPVVIGDFNNDTRPALMVSFNRTSVSELVLSKGIRFGSVILVLTGKLFDETLFEDNASVRVRMAGDANTDGRVDMRDVGLAGKAFGSNLEKTGWNPAADENEDGQIDMHDMEEITNHFMKNYY